MGCSRYHGNVLVPRNILTLSVFREAARTWQPAKPARRGCQSFATGVPAACGPFGAPGCWVLTNLAALLLKTHKEAFNETSSINH